MLLDAESAASTFLRAGAQALADLRGRDAERGQLLDGSEPVGVGQTVAVLVLGPLAHDAVHVGPGAVSVEHPPGGPDLGLGIVDVVRKGAVLTTSVRQLAPT